MACYQLIIAQDTVLFINGKMLVGKVIEYKPKYISIEVTQGKRLKQKKLEAKEVFSVKGKDGAPIIIYQQDIANGQTYTADQMRRFIMGEQFAMKRYYSPWITLGGIVTGAGGGALGFYSLPFPALYTFIMGTHTPTLKKYKDLPDEFKSDPFFKEGFSNKASNRKANNALISGYSAAIATLIVLVLFR